MNHNIVKRRTELLQLLNVGISKVEAVKELSSKYGVSRQTIYEDWRKRGKWLPILLDIKDPELFFLSLMADHREIKRLALKEFLSGDNSNARIGALRLVRDLNKDFLDMIIIRDVELRLNKLENE